MSPLLLSLLLLIGVVGLLTGLTLGLLIRDLHLKNVLRVLMRSIMRVTRKKLQRLYGIDIDHMRRQRDLRFLGTSTAEKVDIRAKVVAAELKRCLTEKFEGQIQDVYLFGSRVRGDYQVDSDVDIGIFLTDSCTCAACIRREALYQSARLLLIHELFLQPRIFGNSSTRTTAEQSLAEIIFSYGVSL